LFKTDLHPAGTGRVTCKHRSLRQQNGDTFLIQELREYTSRLDVESKLHTYGTAVHVLAQPSAESHAKYYLLHLDAVKKQVTVSGFRSDQLELASQRYLEVERAIAEGSEAVLVSVDSLQSLRTAYPNYFLDTKLFVEALKEVIAER
jgi:hypothetical protein